LNINPIKKLYSSIRTQSLKEEHRNAYKDNFFTLNQTESTKAIHAFKKELLGEDNKDPGLLDAEKFSPK